MKRGDIVLLAYPGARYIGLILSKTKFDDMYWVKLYMDPQSVTMGFSLEVQAEGALTKIGSLGDFGITLPEDYRTESWR